MKRFVLVAAVASVLLLALSGIGYVGGGEIAVLDPRFGGPEVWTRGLHFRAPLLSRVTRYPLAPQQVQSRVLVETRDNLNFHLRYTLRETLDPETLLALHARRAGRPLGPVLRQLSDEAVVKAAALLRADEAMEAPDPQRWLGSLGPPAKERGLRPLSIEIAPPDSKVLVNSALLYQQRNLPAAALQLIQSAVQRAPQDASLHFGLGRILELQGHLKEAEDEYLQALFLDPAHRASMGRLVGSLLKRKEFERARRLLTAAIERARTSAPHYNWLGLTLQLEARNDEAQRAFEKAVELDPGSVEYRTNLGALFLARGDRTRAQESLREALKLRPNYALALYDMGIALAMDGKPSDAIPFLERAEGSGPATPGLLNALAKAYQETGQTAKAVAALQRSLKVRPQQPEQEKTLRRLQGSSSRPSAHKSP
ncbi:MAG TPA: tetratricopeptide repeat protein [Candidatus Polarisedimenticolia bacterium]|nr:tetratricopeptide repeat protein [Candidatus Polarisedimenticolia bacterium]